MASTFSPRSRGDREFQKFGLDNTAGDTNPIGIAVGGYTNSTIFQPLKVSWDGTLQTDATVTISSITGSIRIWDGTNFATITNNKLDVNATLTQTALSSVIDSVKIVDGGGSITVDGSVTTTPTALSSVVDSIKIVDGGGSITVDGTFWQATQPVSGTFWQATQPISATELDIRTLTSARDSVKIVDGGGSITIDGDIGTVTTVSTLTTVTNPVTVTANGLNIRDISNARDSIRVSGDIAHDAADSGNPIKIGGKAYNFDGTVPGTAVAEGDRADFITDVYGRQFVETAHPNHFNLNAAYTTAQTSTQLKAAPGAGLNINITDVILTVGGVAGTIKLIDGNAGGAAVNIVPPIAFAANGGAVMNFRTPLRMVANSSLAITSEGVANHSVLVAGFISA